jgi:hypothetical protein
VKVATRKSIEDLQAAAAKLPQCELHTEHYWADGMYCRELFRPADTLIVGKVHKAEHFYIIASGTVTIAGNGYRETITGPKVMVSKPGTKRAVYAHTDATTMTVHRTDETDLEKIEAELIEEDPSACYDAYNVITKQIKELT